MLHLSLICTDHFTTRSKLESPQQQIVAFLKAHGIPESKQPQVSLLFAESMLLELQGAVAPTLYRHLVVSGAPHGDGKSSPGQ